MRILVTGANGVLGRQFLAARPDHVTLIGLSGRPCTPVAGLPLTPLDLTNARALEGAYRMSRPDVVVHLAALANVGWCYREPERARAVNVAATAHLAALCRADGVPLVFTSTDMVFDGTAPPYREDALLAPLSVYGRTKADAERHVLDAGGTVVRLALLYGPGTFLDTMLAALRSDSPLTLFADEYRTPLDLTTAALVLWALVERRSPGVLHAGGLERLSRVEMGQRLAALLGVASPRIQCVSRTSVGGSEPRPADTSLDSSRLRALVPEVAWPSYEAALRARYC